ncbi:MAG: hypothetical protein KDI71_24500 [Xanthomonadales bacterium]|nr:hypothetical protein [Xanthomonadales bacterium]
MSRFYQVLLIAAAAVFALAGCEEKVEEAAKPELVAPADQDNDAWKKYVGEVAKTYVPAGQSARLFVTYAGFGQDEEKTERMVQNTINFLSAGIAKGTFLVFAGDSSLARHVIEEAFAEPEEGKLKEVNILFIGAPEDEAAVRAMIEPWGATVQFHSVK